MGYQSEGVEVSAKECLGLLGWEWRVWVSCGGMGVRKILWAVLYFNEKRGSNNFEIFRPISKIKTGNLIHLPFSTEFA